MIERPQTGGLTRRTALAAAFGGVAGSVFAQGAPRVAALDWSTAELALSLGVDPVAASEASGYRAWVEVPILPPTCLDLGLRVQPNLELLAELKPDLLLTIPDRRDIEPALTRIAPAMSLPIYTAACAPLEQATIATRDLAQRLGLEDAARRVVAGLDETVARCRDRLRHAGRRPVAMIRFVDARTVFIFGAGSLFDAVLGRLGLANAWKAPPSRWGFTQVPLTELARLDPDARLLYLDRPIPADVTRMMREDPLWNGLPAVRRRDAAPLSTVWFFGALPSAERFATILTDRLTAAAESRPG